jgi:hypothetical protein
MGAWKIGNDRLGGRWRLEPLGGRTRGIEFTPSLSPGRLTVRSVGWGAFILDDFRVPNVS